MCTALIAVVASVSGLNVAQQSLALDLGATQGQLLWVINGYTMALAALLLPIGAIGDRFGRNPILVSGLVLFMGANVVVGLATSTGMLLAARVLAGVAAAMIMPVTLSVITSSFPAEQRARAVGIWSGFAGAGGILGLFVSSFLIDKFTWPWLFAMPVAFAGVSLVMTLRAVANSREHRHGSFDTVGSILSAIAIGALVLGIHEGPDRGWTDGLTLFGLVLGAAALLAFAAWELRRSAPLLQLRVFADRRLASGALTLLILFAVMFGIFLVLTQFLQAVLGYSALKASAGLLPMAMLMMPLSSVAPSIASRFGTRRALMAGVGLFGAASLCSPSWRPPAALLVGAAGAVHRRRRDGARHEPGDDGDHRVAARRPAGRGVGAQRHRARARWAVGVALLGSIVNAGSSVSSATASPSPALAHRVDDGIGAAFGAAQDLGPSAPRVLDAARDALVDGWRLSMWFGVALAAAALVFVRGPRPTVAPALEPEQAEQAGQAELEPATA